MQCLFSVTERNERVLQVKFESWFLNITLKCSSLVANWLLEYFTTLQSCHLTIWMAAITVHVWRRIFWTGQWPPLLDANTIVPVYIGSPVADWENTRPNKEFITSNCSHDAFLVVSPSNKGISTVIYNTFQNDSFLNKQLSHTHLKTNTLFLVWCDLGVFS